MILAALWGAVVLLIIVAVLEIWYPRVIDEGFTGLISIGDNAFWSRYFPRRGDVGPEEEDRDYIRDPRYFTGYADVQRLGHDHDFCRMVIPKGGGQDDAFFACALGGTDGLSTVKFRTATVRDGFELSRDDYMSKINGTTGYCRILKVDEGTYEPKCNLAGDTEFRQGLTLDTQPPKEVQTLLDFYQGIVFWLRLRDDMVDYAKNLRVSAANDLRVEESPPKPEATEGLIFNGIDQFLRIGDTKDLEFGDRIQLRYLRAISFWVYFEEFTNNAHILDFGNGAGKDNVWVGIVGRGNMGAEEEPIRPLLCGGETTVPDAPSGAQAAAEMSPQRLMETTAANCDEWSCKKPEVFGRIMPPLQPKAKRAGGALAKTADLVYEIWDHQQRKYRLQVKNAVTLQRWTHVAITATSPDPMRPNIAVYVNGEKVLEEPGWLPQTNYTTNNYIGKSNWQNVTSLYENADELFKGRLFDLRGYRTPMTEKKIAATVEWGKGMLGMDDQSQSPTK